MSELKENPLSAEVSDLKEKFFSGRSALEEEQVKLLYKELQSVIKNISDNDLLSTDTGLVTELTEICKSVVPGEFANQLMESFDKEIFFRFGNYLLVNADKERIHSLIHEYLNLFRFSSFLKRIYEEERWEKLIEDLILQSNYTIRNLFNQRVRDYRNKPLFRIIKGNNVSDISWSNTAELVNNYARSFNALLKSENEENGKVAFLIENCPEMAMLDIACLTSGVVNLMIPANSVPEHISFILNQTNAAVVIAHNEKQLAKIKSVKNELHHLKKIVLLIGSSADDFVISFEEFLTGGKDADESLAEKLLEQLNPDSLATIMYTSGTTGEPKGDNVFAYEHYLQTFLPCYGST